MEQTQKSLSHDFIDSLKACLPWTFFPCTSFYLMESFHHNPFVNMNTRVQFLNIAVFVCIAVILWMLTGSRKMALKIQSITSLGIGVLEYYVLAFRGTPIVPWDFFSLKTAASVSADYDYSLEWQAILSILGFIVLILLEDKIKDVRLNRKEWVVRLSGGVLAFSILFGEYQMLKSPQFVSNMWIYNKLFTPYAMIKRDGIALAFLLEMQYMEVEKPNGYVDAKVEDAYEALSGEVLAVETDEKLPNVIVMMNEAFSDPAVLGDFVTNEDYMPYLHSLQEGHDNTITGTMNVSVVAGNTANTEFEFLTGHTMAFLPQGSVAYQQYLKNDSTSLSAYLKSLGYSTIAIHPYYADGWERDSVYPMLGFDEFLSKDDFTGAKKIRKYISDEACFDRIIELYEEKEEGEPLFVFNVTMQNHSGYDEVFANFTPDIEAEGINSKVLNQYLSLMKKTDEAFEELIAYFSEQEEDTMIVFFGDHQPTTYVSNSIVRSNGLQPDSLSLEENLLKYKVPYVIWSNFEMSGTTAGGETSVNYLAIDVLENCGLPLPQYQNYLKELREDYPIISAQQIRDARGNLCTDEDSEEKQEKDADAVLPYKSLQYYLLFDWPEN